MSAKVEVVSKAKVNLKVTTVAGSGGGVSDHGQLTGLLDDDHPQYQRSEATWVSTSSFTITDESIVITTGSAVTLPDAQTHPSRTIGVGAAAQTVTISPTGTDTMFDDPGNSYVLPQGNGITFVSVQISGAWGWAIYTRNGPAFDMPKWYGQSLADGQVLKISGGVPAWGTASGGSGTVTSVSGTAPISVANGTSTPAISIAAASTSAAGSMSSADFTKLAGIATGATANSSDATLLARANHTGTQTLSTISDAGTAAAKNVPATGDASSTQVVLGSDTRLTNARTPSSHASSHGSAGSDPITVAQSQVTNLTTDLAGKLSSSDASVTNARVPQWRRLTFSDAAYDLSATPSPAVSGSVVLQQTGTLSAARTVTLPAASACPAGSEIIVNAGAGASATNTVTIQRAGSDTINGATTSVVIGTAWGQRRFVSDGVSAWAYDDGLVRRSQNLSDLASASTARTNLGLATVAASGSASDLSTGTLNAAQLPNLFPIYGTGASGDVTISSGTTTLTGDVHYSNLTVASGATLVTAGYRVFVTGTLSGAGTISNNGVSTGNAGGGSGGASGGIFASAGTGGNGGLTNGTQAGALTNKLGGSGGAGGNSSSGTGGAAQTGTTLAATAGGQQIAGDLWTMLIEASIPSAQRIAGGTGGSGGAGNNSGTGGGGGGGGGGIVYVGARAITFTGSIEAVGGNGGSRTTTGTGGGGGGGGGVVLIATASTTQTFTTSVAGGTGGAGNGSGTTSGGNGTAGTSTVYLGVK